MGFDVTIYKKCDDDTKTITHPLYKVITRLKRTKKYKMVKVSGPYSNNQYSFVFTSQKRYNVQMDKYKQNKHM